jgi:hypothetical protein
MPPVAWHDSQFVRTSGAMSSCQFGRAAGAPSVVDGSAVSSAPDVGVDVPPVDVSPLPVVVSAPLSPHATSSNPHANL